MTPTKKPKPAAPGPLRVGDKVRLRTDGGYTEASAAGLTPGSVHEVAGVHGPCMGVSLLDLKGSHLYFRLCEFERASAPAPASKVRRYVAFREAHWWSVCIPTRQTFTGERLYGKTVARGMSRADARAFAALKNATTTSKRKGSK